jgi:hypothetical protein
VENPQAACVNGGDSASADCILSYYVSGGLELISPWPYLNYSLSDSPIYTVWHNQGYHFDFSALDSLATFDGATDCNMYGEQAAAVLFCLTISQNSALNMSMVSPRIAHIPEVLLIRALIEWINCPVDISSQSQCLDDSSWQASTGWTATLRSYRQTATVHYYRSNQTIAALTDLGTATPVAISPHDLFRVYNDTFQPNGFFGQYATGRQFILFLNNFLGFASLSAFTKSSALDHLRNLAVLPLYYFQPTLLNPALVASPNNPAAGLPHDLYTTAAFSTPSFRLVVGRATLLIYTAVGSVLLLLCLAALALGSLHAFAGRIVEPSPFSALDLSVGCTDGSTENGLTKKLQDCKGLAGRQLLEKLKGIRIYLLEASGASPRV